MIFNVCAAFLSWLLPSHDQTQHALQWWHQRQVDRLHDGAELIRDGVLQDLFAIRRTLELAHEECEPASQKSLQQLEALHQRLEQVSNTLSPAFIQDSLPLAIQHWLHLWQGQHPQVSVTVHFADQEQASIPINRIVLMTLDEWLRLVSPHLSSDAALELALKRQGRLTFLTVRVKEPVPQKQRAIAHLQDLAYLHRSFQFLTGGHSQQGVHGLWIEWQFSWSSDPKS